MNNFTIQNLQNTKACHNNFTQVLKIRILILPIPSKLCLNSSPLVPFYMITGIFSAHSILMLFQYNPWLTRKEASSTKPITTLLPEFSSERPQGLPIHTRFSHCIPLSRLATLISRRSGLYHPIQSICKLNKNGSLLFTPTLQSNLFHWCLSLFGITYLVCDVNKAIATFIHVIFVKVVLLVISQSMGCHWFSRRYHAERAFLVSQVGVHHLVVCIEGFRDECRSLKSIRGSRERKVRVIGEEDFTKGKGRVLFFCNLPFQRTIYLRSFLSFFHFSEAIIWHAAQGIRICFSQSGWKDLLYHLIEFQVLGRSVKLAGSAGGLNFQQGKLEIQTSDQFISDCSCILQHHLQVLCPCLLFCFSSAFSSTGVGYQRKPCQSVTTVWRLLAWWLWQPGVWKDNLRFLVSIVTTMVYSRWVLFTWGKTDRYRNDGPQSLLVISRIYSRLIRHGVLVPPRRQSSPSYSGHNFIFASAGNWLGTIARIEPSAQNQPCMRKFFRSQGCSYNSLFINSPQICINLYSQYTMSINPSNHTLYTHQYIRISHPTLPPPRHPLPARCALHELPRKSARLPRHLACKRVGSGHMHEGWFGRKGWEREAERGGRHLQEQVKGQLIQH